MKCKIVNCMALSVFKVVEELIRPKGTFEKVGEINRTETVEIDENDTVYDWHGNQYFAVIKGGAKIGYSISKGLTQIERRKSIG